MVASITHAGARRAVLAHRRLIRDSVLSPLICDVEHSLEARYGPYLPLRSVYRHDSGMKALVSQLRLASGGNRYRLNGNLVLHRSSSVGIDELEHIDYRGLSEIVDHLAARVEKARLLRGRGGRYGMISRGVVPPTLNEIGQDFESYESLDWLLVGELDDVAAVVARRLSNCWKTAPRSLRCGRIRRMYDAFVDEHDVDEAMRDLLVSTEAGSRRPILEEGDASLFGLMLWGARPKGWSWHTLAQAKLGIQANTTAAASAAA